MLNSLGHLQNIGETKDKEKLRALIHTAYSEPRVAEGPIFSDMIQVDVHGAGLDAEFIELPGLAPV